MSNGPTFVVVGHVNRGKSSIVSTLAADDSVHIAPEPGTTLHNRAFPMRLDGNTLYTLIDTPGFERARQALDWLKDDVKSTPARNQAVRRFIEAHKDDSRFAQECRLLQPIMDGGAILYVIDGSVPFSPAYEAEMEVLRWTAQPRMALINTVGPDDHTAEWKKVLDQYFSLVRDFDAHDAGFHDRLRILQAIGELREDFRAPMDRAVKALKEDRAAAQRDAAAEIAQMLVSMLTHVEEERLIDEAEPEPRKAPLAERYYRDLRRMEQRCRKTVRQLYDHNEFDIQDSQLPTAPSQSPGARGVGDDLFDTGTWSRLGLSRTQLASAATVSAALVGGAFDAAVLGHSFMLGTVIGGAVGFGSSWFGWKHLEDVTLLGKRFAGRLLRIGPMRNPQFPWIALDRALIHHDLISRRPHAHRENITLGQYNESQGVARQLDPARRAEIEKSFAKLRRPTGETHKVQTELANAIAAILAERDK